MTFIIVALIISNVALWVMLGLTISWARDVDASLSRLVDWIVDNDEKDAVRKEPPRT